MSDAFQLGVPFTSRFSRERPDLLGDQLRLKLDPEIEAEINRLKLRMEIQKIQAAWLQPNWLDLHKLVKGISPPAPSGQAQPWMKPNKPLQQKALIPAPPLQPPNNGPDQLESTREASVSDLLGAIWKVPVVKDSAKQLTDQLEKDFWKDRTTGEKVMIVSWGTMIAGGTIAGILGNQQSRLWALQTINGKEISVPGISGLSFKLQSERGSLVGGGLTLPIPPAIGFGLPVPDGLSLSLGSQRHTPDNAPAYQEHLFTVQLDVTKALPSIFKTK